MMIPDYDQALLAKIAGKYSECAVLAAGASQDIEVAKLMFLENYTGDGAKMSEEAFDKLLRHLALLGLCFSEMASGVEYVNDTMTEIVERGKS